MKKSKIFILITTIILVALTVVAMAAAMLSDATLGIIDAIINGEEYDVINDLNGDEKVDILDVILGVKKDNFDGPKLQTLTLDGGYTVDEEVKYDNFTYTVQLPAGRPRIPHITATTDAENATVAYQNATIADDESFGYAKVIISDKSGENVYTVKFERAEVEEKNATIALQYDDRWTFTPNSNDVWTIVDVIEPGVFTATYNNVLGRYTEKGLANFEGWFDYLDIKVDPAEVLYDTHYRWDFEEGKEYDSTYDKNTLTKTDDKHTISGGDYVTSGKAGELKMENAVVLDDKHDWMIETEFLTYEDNVMLIGLKNCNIDGKHESHIYFSSTGYKGVRIEPDPNAGSGITVPFNDSTAVKTAMKQMNKWRIGYEVVTDTLTVYMYNTTTGAWDEAGKLEAAPRFTVTSDCLFGDFDGANSYNMNGTVKYFDILVEDLKVVGAKEYVYNWDFSSWESTALQNTLTPGATSGTVSSGKYTTTTRGDELALQVPITLDSTNDWSIEWSAAASSTSYSDYSLIATNKSAEKYNHIYFSPNAYNAIVFKSAAGTEFAKLPFATEKATTKTLSAASNTWKIEYKKDINELSIQRWDSTNGQWIEKSYVNPPAFSMELSHLFGDFGSSKNGDNWVNFRGTADYMTVRYTVAG